ncbi:hypothetical protein [Microbacterium sp. YY-01]|uniref:hypothetical protein n=1 Tax=Microbacterium sp. YY-01 TaxID=3421634 RepID=UPI003D1641EE
MIVAALPLFARDHAWQPASIASAILLAAFALVAVFTVGIFYIPAVIAAITAASMKPRQ